MKKNSQQEGFFRFKVNNYKNNNNELVVQLPSDPNKAMRFDDKTDEEFVKSSNYKTNLPIEVLISNPEPKRKRRNKIPRRLNKWIIYRRDKSTKFKGLKASIVTEKVRKMWANEPEEVKEFFAALSRLAVKSHIKKYGEGYKYKPGPYRRGKKRERKERMLSPSSEESSPDISELMDTTSSSSSSSPDISELMDTTSSSSSSSPELPFFQTPLLESQSDINFETFTELPFLTPESIIYSPAASSISNFDNSLEYPMQAFPPLSDISFEPDELPGQPPAQHLTPAASNFATSSCSAFEKLLSTFTEEQQQLLKLVQDNCVSIERDSCVRDLLEENSDVNYTANDYLNGYQMDAFNDTTKSQDDWFSTNQDQTYTNDIQYNLMDYNNDIQQLDNTTDWLLFDIENSDVDDTSFDYTRQLFL